MPKLCMGDLFADTKCDKTGFFNAEAGNFNLWKNASEMHDLAAPLSTKARI